ncbi:hypothetical protein PVAP13_7KG153910 [Panicum virgatum]|uniref:Secreted protein n=1 Tax=Panicum virgatum TaxID=38727 RepID=A0A8T0QHR1_PANVG|nr:hypothetical protein PVAP13_7KG153910 [Panicum virgatum]
MFLLSLSLTCAGSGCGWQRMQWTRVGSGRCLHEDQAMFVCKLHAFVVAHCTPVRQITFVPNQHYRHVGVGVLPHILRTAHEVIESLPCGINPTWIPMVLSA